MKKIILKVIAMTAGAVLAGIGLELFLVPNEINDGGITGISIMLSHITNTSLGLFLIILSIPFLIIGYKAMGKEFTALTAYGIIIFAIAATTLHHHTPFTDDVLLATIFGGIIMGVGMGIGIRAGGAIDGIETLAIVINEKTPFSVGELVLIFNLIILTISGFVFSWESAMYSFIAFYITFKTIDLVLVGLDESRSVIIITKKPELIGNAIINEMHHSVTYLEGAGGYSNEATRIVYCIITRLEERHIKDLLNKYDPEAFMTITNVSEVRGGRFGYKAH